MALTFGQTKGGAQKRSVDSYKYTDGENRFRIVGDICARYVYWIKGENAKDIPFECLAFDRDTEKFNNAEKDWVKEYYPDQKCSWAYAVQVIDPSDGKLKVCNLKKKLFDQILSAAEDLGDPTDPDTGWTVVFDKKKTGPLPINVEYTLKVLRCKTDPLTDEQRELIKDLKSMDQVLPRPTPEDQKKLLEKLRSGDSAPDEQAEEVIGDEFTVR